MGSAPICLRGRPPKYHEHIRTGRGERNSQHLFMLLSRLHTELPEPIIIDDLFNLEKKETEVKELSFDLLFERREAAVACAFP